MKMAPALSRIHAMRVPLKRTLAEISFNSFGICHTCSTLTPAARESLQFAMTMPRGKEAINMAAVVFMCLFIHCGCAINPDRRRTCWCDLASVSYTHLRAHE